MNLKDIQLYLRIFQLVKELVVLLYGKYHLAGKNLIFITMAGKILIILAWKQSLHQRIYQTQFYIMPMNIINYFVTLKATIKYMIPAAKITGIIYFIIKYF